MTPGHVGAILYVIYSQYRLTALARSDYIFKCLTYQIPIQCTRHKPQDRKKKLLTTEELVEQFRTKITPRADNQKLKLNIFLHIYKEKEPETPLVGSELD